MWYILWPIVAAVVLWIYYKKTYFVWTNQGVKQTKPWPILGDAYISLFQIMSFPEFSQKMYNMYPGTRYTGGYQFQRPALMLKDPELIKQIAIKDFDHFTDHRGIGSTESDPLFNKNLFTLKGQEWRDMRALLSGSFTSSKMKVMHNLIADASIKFVDYFWNKSEDFIKVELKDVFTRYTNDVIATTSFGIEVDSLSDPTNEFYVMGREISNFNSLKSMLSILGNLLFPKLYNFFKISVLSKKASVFFINVIDQTIRTREENNIVRPDMLNLLLEAKKGDVTQEHSPVLDTGFAVVEESQHILKHHHKKHIELTNMDITAQAVIFFVAGFDTVSSAMSNCCYELAINPEVQDKLRAEIKDGFNESTKPLSYEAVLSMKYLDMVVTEALRKYPALSIIDRLCTKSYTIEPTSQNEHPIHLKPGNMVWFPSYPIHHDPQYYPDPEKFIPERFSDENKHKLKPYAYLPFGIGPRACIGSRFALLELKIILVYLLNKFEVVPTEETKIPLELSKQSINVVSDSGYHVAFKKLK